MADGPTINPYAPPASEVDQPAGGVAQSASARPLYSVKQMGVAAFFGSIVAGIVLLQANYRAMGRSDVANRTLGLGLLVAAAVFAVLSLLPDSFPTSLVNIALALAFHRLGASLQGEAVSRHMAAGGARQSNWRVTGHVIGCALVVIAIMSAILSATGRLD